MSKEYRKKLGFSSAFKVKDFLSAKDISLINWELIERYNERLIDVFETIQKTLPLPKKDIRTSIMNAYSIISCNDILPKLSNHGRAPESVYFVWMQGYISTILFQPLIEQKLNTTLYNNGADDLTNPAAFSRKSDPDLANKDHTVFVEIQAGFKGSKVDIKKSKVKLSDTAEYYIACFDCFNGTYTILNTKEIPEDQWYSNPQWEGALCYTVPKECMKEWI